MQLDSYRRVLAVPGVRSLILIALAVRVPVTASGLALMLHVVMTLDRGYGPAGLVGAAFTVGAGVGAPVFGRFVDRRGLRPMLAITAAGQAVFWTVAPILPFPALIGAALCGGLLGIPIFSVIRQSLAALVPEIHRKAAFSIDSMSVELSFMAGPPLAILAVTQLSTTTTVWLVGGSMVLGGLVLLVLNPPTRAAHEAAVGSQPLPPRRTWLRPPLLAVLLAGVAITMVLGGTDVGVVALLREADQVEWTGLVLAVWAIYSLLGGFVFGAIRHSPHPLVLAGLLGLTTMIAGLAADWGWLCLLLLPAGALCAPALAASADAVSRLVPAAARGEAMGLHGTALTTGIALGSPFAGAVVDAVGPRWAFVVLGAVGALLALVGLTMSRRASVAPRQSAPALPAEVPAA